MDINIFAVGDNIDSYSTKGRTLSAISDKSPSSDSSILELQDYQPNSTQSLQLAPAAVSPYQLDLKNDHLLKRRRRGAIRNDYRKRPRIRTSMRLATTASTASVAPSSADLEEPKSRVQIITLDKEYQVRDTHQEMIDDTSDDDSDDEDYADRSDAAGSQRYVRLRSRKRIRRTKDKEGIQRCRKPSNLSPQHLILSSCSNLV